MLQHDSYPEREPAMKTYRNAALSLILITIGCASSNQPRPAADNSTLTAEEIARHGHEPIEVMLQRKFPGVQVLRNADGEITLNIRGSATTSGAPKEPLYVINDMEVEPRGRGLESLVNAYEIESIKVLRGGEAAIYGVRGADGVIVIKTKGATRKN
jgi:TonB-dependent starch-binding outer membrane protein SusC